MLPENPVILFSMINMKLRDRYSSLDELCEDLDVEKQALLDRMRSAGFTYDEKQNQFV